MTASVQPAWEDISSHSAPGRIAVTNYGLSSESALAGPDIPTDREHRAEGATEAISEAALLDSQGYVNRKVLEELHSPPGTPLSRQVQKELYALTKRKNVKNDSRPPRNPNGSLTPWAKAIKVSAYDNSHGATRARQIIAEPASLQAKPPDRSPLSVRPEKKQRLVFKKLGPGITQSGHLIPSTVLGDPEAYAANVLHHQIPETSHELIDQLGMDMRKARAFLATRVETAKEPVPRDKTAACLKNFETKTNERTSIAKRIANTVDRRVSRLAMSDADNYPRQKEIRELAAINSGPRSVYETAGPGLRPLGDQGKVIPELLRSAPYSKLSFTQKPHLLKLMTGTAAEDCRNSKRLSTKQFLDRDGWNRNYHDKCAPELTDSQNVPLGMRNPDFDGLVVKGANRPNGTDDKECKDENSLVYLKKNDRGPPLEKPAGINPFVLIAQPMISKDEAADFVSSTPTLTIQAQDDDDVTISKTEDRTEIFIKLFARPQRPPASASLILSNKGREGVRFGLKPVCYENPLWPVTKTGLLYFLQPTGVLEEGNTHVLTVVFECKIEGEFGEAFQLWLLPKTAEPKNVRLIVHCRSDPPSLLIFPDNDWEIQEDAPPEKSSQMLDRIKNMLEGFSEDMRPVHRPTLEEVFKLQNNLDYNSEAVAKLRNLWIFAHLRHDMIPWYERLIERERGIRGEVPGLITKQMLQELANAQARPYGELRKMPEYVSQGLPTEKDGVFWRKPGKQVECVVHDKDMSLPDTVTLRTKPVDPPRTPAPDPAKSPTVIAGPPNVQSPYRSPDDKPPQLQIPLIVEPIPEDSPSVTAHSPEGFETAKMSTTKQHTRRVSESASDWVPLALINDGAFAHRATVLPKPKPPSRPPAFSLERNPYLANTASEYPPADPEKAASNEALMDEKWLRHCLDQDWVTTAVLYVLEGKDNDSAETDRIPEWDYSVATLREGIEQATNHHIFIRIGLLRELAKIERSMLHIQPNIPTNFGETEKTEELLITAMDHVTEKATEYASDLYAYFERCALRVKPEEPAMPPELTAAREKKKQAEEILGKSAGPKGKKPKIQEPPPEEVSSASSGRSRGARDSGDKGALLLKSPKSSQKPPASGKDRRGNSPAVTDTGKNEKEAKELAAMEAEYEASLEAYEANMVEYRTWRREKEKELEHKISALVSHEWQNELNILNDTVQKPIHQVQLEEEEYEQDLKTKFLDERRANTLEKVYDSLMDKGGNLALAVSAWKLRISDSLMKPENRTKFSKIHDDWELRRKEVKLFKKELPDERFRLPIRYIWRLPATYQAAARAEEPLPQRLRQNDPKELKVRVSNLLANSPKTPLPPIPELALRPSAEFRPSSKQKRVPQEEAAKLSDTVRDCLDALAKDRISKEVSKDGSSDEWETDTEVLADAWAYEPATVATEEKLPVDFKYVSFKRPPEPKQVRTSGLGTKYKPDKSGALPKEEHSSSSSEEEFEDLF